MLKAVLAAALFTPVWSLTDIAQDALIIDLPGLPPGVNITQYAGYLPVSPDKNMFYWFIESMGNPSKDPLVLWTNGGPGCSGIGGMLSEMGPFRPTENGDLELNEMTWNSVANIVYIEQPAGVGFSYNTSAVGVYDDAQCALDNTAFIEQFLAAYPEFTPNEFYLSSESFGGHYLPTLAKQLVVDGTSANFKGFAVGNPMTYLLYRDYGQYGTFAGHQLLPKPAWDAYLALGCKDNDKTEACVAAMESFDELTSGLDPYALDFPVCSTDLATGRRERHQLVSYLKRAGAHGPKSASHYEPCSGDWVTAYLNRADVQLALHAAKDSWSMCGGIDYDESDFDVPMMPYYQFLINGGFGLRILVYSGDDDSICATMGSQEWIWGLGYNVTDAWAPWMMDGQVAGFRVAFEGFEFVTVHGAGHMVPATKPAQGLTVFKNFLAGEW